MAGGAAGALCAGQPEGTCGVSKAVLVVARELWRQDHYLNPVALEAVEEVLKMSMLGQMIFEDGVEKGIERGMERGMEKSIVKIVTTMLSKNKTVEEIHEDTDIPMKQILKIQESLESRSR